MEIFQKVSSNYTEAECEAVLTASKLSEKLAAVVRKGVKLIVEAAPVRAILMQITHAAAIRADSGTTTRRGPQLPSGDDHYETAATHEGAAEEEVAWRKNEATAAPKRKRVEEYYFDDGES